MLLYGTFKNEQFEFYVEVFVDKTNMRTFLVHITDTTYMLVHKHTDTRPWLQISGSFIQPDFREAIFDAMSCADQSNFQSEIMPLSSLNKQYLR